MMTTCLKNYYNFLDLKEKVDIHALVSHIKSMFYSLYDEYLKFMVRILILILNPRSLKVNLLHQPDLIRGIKYYFINPKKQKVADHHKARPLSFKVI